jgi:hypothetical protein
MNSNLVNFEVLKSSPELKSVYFGPGTWFSMHLMAFNAHKNNSKQQKEATVWYIRLLSDNFYCKKCGEHFKDYLGKNPPEASSDIFAWTVNFHNHVNRDIRKETWEYQTAYDYYNTVTACEKSCDARSHGVEITEGHDPFGRPSSKGSVKSSSDVKGNSDINTSNLKSNLSFADPKRSKDLSSVVNVEDSKKPTLVRLSNQKSRNTVHGVAFNPFY